MKSTLLRAGLAVVVAASAAFGLSACGGGSEGATSGSGSDGAGTSGSATTGEESEAFVADMKEGVQIINDQIAAQDGPMTQIMLASDVEQPTQKYGMWVMPYYPSEAVESFTMSIQIENGTNFVVTAVSAETGKTWTMDQAGKMTEVAE